MSDDPRTWDVRRDADGTRYLKLPNGVVQTYTEDELAGMVVAAIKDAQAGLPVSEAYLVTLKHVCGEEEFRQAATMVALEPEILEALGVADLS